MLDGVLTGLFGLLIGSFLNVCIHRWPRDLSVVRPRSRCPSCERQIAWYDNIPLLSWILLQARCRFCGGKISWRYPVVELLTGACFFWFGLHLGVSLGALKYCVFCAILIALVFSDVETMLLPDELTIGGALIGLAFSWFVPVVPPQNSVFSVMAGAAGFHPGPRLGSFGEALLGAALPAGTLWFAGWLFEKIRHKEGLGFGDVKMLAMVGTFLGLGGALLTCFAGSVVGSVVGIAWIVVARKKAAMFELPLGSFLGAAALFNALAGQNWYWALFG